MGCPCCQGRAKSQLAPSDIIGSLSAMAEIALDVADFTANTATAANLLGGPVISKIWEQFPSRILRKSDKYLQKILVLLDGTQHYMNSQMHRDFHVEYDELYQEREELAEIQGIPNKTEYARMRKNKRQSKGLCKRLIVSSQRERSKYIWARMPMSDSANLRTAVVPIIPEEMDDHHVRGSTGGDGVDMSQQYQSCGRMIERYPSRSTANIPLMEAGSSTTRKNDSDSMCDGSSIWQHEPMHAEDVALRPMPDRCSTV
ncbi:hypothetical protein DAEQUDRAFT_809709 [Daedalea quercina L-15889]|uniref:Uncharacterized protein n=1 Tax=Daedalea quercina L-15889 TaxID=1314783 RepID=A0A165SBC4_9APHY|nr:hypothetical protein DAEQUDRAFT_809709 [Daedalea quercina L-15889]